MDDDGKARMSPATPDEIRAMQAFIEEQRTEVTPFDVVVEGKTPGDDHEQAAALVRPYRDAGATWWIEALWSASDLDQVLTRIRQGPPCVE